MRKEIVIALQEDSDRRHQRYLDQLHAERLAARRARNGN